MCLVCYYYYFHSSSILPSHILIKTTFLKLTLHTLSSDPTHCLKDLSSFYILLNSCRRIPIVPAFKLTLVVVSYVKILVLKDTY